MSTDETTPTPVDPSGVYNLTAVDSAIPTVGAIDTIQTLEPKQFPHKQLDQLVTNMSIGMEYNYQSKNNSNSQSHTSSAKPELESENPIETDDENKDETPEPQIVTNDTDQDTHSQLEESPDKDTIPQESTDQPSNEDSDKVESEIVPIYTDSPVPELTITDSIPDDYMPPEEPNQWAIIVDYSALPPLESNPEQDSRSASQLQAFEKDGTLPPEEDRPLLLQYAQRQKVNAICKHNYPEAQRYQNLIADLVTEINIEQSRNIHNKQLESVRTKLQETSAKLEAMDKANAEEMQNLKDKHHTRRVQLEQDHDEEMDDFEHRWNDEEYLRKFEKPTMYLMEKQRIEQRLVVQKKYEEAESVRIEVEALEQSESDEAQQRAINEMKRQQFRLEAKFASELAAFESTCETEVALLEREHRLKAEGTHARKIKLEKELDNLQYQKPPPPPPAATGNLNVMTPRTAQRFNGVKQSVRSPKITVKPMGKVIKKKKSPARNAHE